MEVYPTTSGSIVQVERETVQTLNLVLLLYTPNLKK